MVTFILGAIFGAITATFVWAVVLIARDENDEHRR